MFVNIASCSLDEEGLLKIMYNTEDVKFINQIIELFYKCDFWQNEKTTFLNKIKIWLWLTLLAVGFPIMCLLGSFLNDEKEDSLFLACLGITCGVLTVKAFYSHIKQDEILLLLKEACNHSVADREEFQRITTKLNNFKNFAVSLVICFIGGISALLASGLYVKKLPINIWFPLDTTSSKTSYWIGFVYAGCGLMNCIFIFLSTLIFWYIMLNCSTKYETLAKNFQQLGVIKNAYKRNIIEYIQIHHNIKQLIERLRYVFSNLLFLQITTSGLCICGSIYTLAFNWSENVFQNIYYIVLFIYSIFDIFMVMFFGNEIKLCSNRLSYCLFESNWLDQSQSNKRNNIILTEVLRQPQELIIGEVFRLNLETFTSILNLAYRMYNILQNM